MVLSPLALSHVIGRGEEGPLVFIILGLKTLSSLITTEDGNSEKASEWLSVKADESVWTTRAGGGSQVLGCWDPPGLEATNLHPPVCKELFAGALPIFLQ